MNEKHELTWQQAVQLAHLQAWAMSFICGFLALCAAAAMTRIPHYLAVSDYARPAGALLFGLLVLVGLADNIRTHIRLWQRKSTVA